MKEPNKTSQRHTKPLLVIAGQFQNGKSTFLNCLLGGNYAIEGEGTLATTKCNAKYVYGDFSEIRTIQSDKSASRRQDAAFFSRGASCCDAQCGMTLQISAYSPVLQTMDLLDSPGFAANAKDDTAADEALRMADFVVLVARKTLDNKSDINFLQNITEKGKHFTVIFNCYHSDRPDSAKSRKTCSEIFAQLKNAKLDSNYIQLAEDFPVYPVNLLWAQCALGYLTEDEVTGKLEAVKHYLKKENLTPAVLLDASNFLPVRDRLQNIVGTFFNYTPHTALNLLQNVADSWSGELIDIFKNKETSNV